MRHPIFENFTDASVYAHCYWDVLPHNAKDLNTTLKFGFVGRWKKFIKARNLFLSLRQQGVSRKEAFETVYKSNSIRLKAVKPWKPTAGNPNRRRGSVESSVDRKKKTGTKSKFSDATIDATFRYADRHNGERSSLKEKYFLEFSSSTFF